MCESMKSFLNVSSWSLVTLGIVVLIVKLLLVCSEQHGWARISTLYGFNTVVVVVGILQLEVVLMNEAFSFDSMRCHGIHSFPHLMTR